MKQYLGAAVVRRPSLPLTARDEEDLALLRSGPERRAHLARLSGEDVAAGDISESALLHAVLQAGLAAIQEAAEEAGYAQLAREQADGADGRRAEARRRTPTWAHEQ